MIIDATATVGQIAADHPETIRVFQRLGLDFCCGGRLRLDEACRRKGLALDETISALQVERVVDEGNPATKTLRALQAYIIETHHTFTRDELARLDPLVEKVARVHGERHPELIALASLFVELRDELTPHLLKEERILFPAIEALEQHAAGLAPRPHTCFGSVDRPVAAMVMEHESAGHILNVMREVTHDYALPDDACGSFRAIYHGLQGLEADLHRHIHLENNVLFPRAVALEAAPAGSAGDM